MNFLILIVKKQFMLLCEGVVHEKAVKQLKHGYKNIYFCKFIGTVLVNICTEYICKARI